MQIGKHLDHPALKAIRDAAATIRAVSLFATSAIAAFIVAYTTWGKGVMPQELAIYTIGSLILIFGLFSWGLRNASRGKPENAWLVKNMESTLLVEKIDGHHRYKRTRDQVVVCRVSYGPRLFPQAWYWTGQSSEPYEVRSLFPGHIIFDGVRPEQDHWTYHWLYLGREIRKRDSVRIGTQLTIEDDKGPMRKFYTEGGNGYKIESLRVTLRFPKGEDPAKVEAYSWPRRAPNSQPSVSLSSARTVNKDGTIDYTIAIVGPSRKLLYGFLWE